MTLKSHRKALLLLVAAVAAVVTTAVASGADQPFKTPKTTPDGQVAVDAVREGRARKLPTSPGRAVTTMGVWHGCRFVFVKSNVSTYEPDKNTLVEVVEAPEPLPAKDPGCVDREPTDVEIQAMQAQVGAANAAARSPGAPPLPDLPPRAGRP